MSPDSNTTPPLPATTSPFRRRPPPDPDPAAQIEQALSEAHRARRRASQKARWLTWLAVGGYLAAAVTASPRGEDSDRVSRTTAWTCMAAGATCAMFLAGRAGARAHDLEAEIAWFEQISAVLSRSPRG